MTRAVPFAAALAAVAAITGAGALPRLPQATLAAATLAAAALVFVATRRLFDACLWRQPWVARWRGIPDLSGGWCYRGTALNPDGSVLYPWEARVTIRQTGSAIVVLLETDRSRSISRKASPVRLPDGGVKLRYDYASDPGHEATASHTFFGVTQFLFAPGGDRAEGVYFNFNGRYSFGRALLTRA